MDRMKTSGFVVGVCALALSMTAGAPGHRATVDPNGFTQTGSHRATVDPNGFTQTGSPVDFNG